MKKRIKTAVVGAGHLGRHHLRWLSQLPESEFVGFYDIDASKSEKYAAEYNTTAFQSLGELAVATEMASVVVPTSAHFETASLLIEQGVHCLIEKPIATTIEQAGKLARQADDKGVKVSVGHIERFNPAVRTLDKTNMRPSFIEAHRLAPFSARGTDVAVVLDLMIHDIDLALHFIRAKVTEIQASAVAVVSEQADIANARLTFENGAVANLTASRISLKEMRKFRMFQRSGYYSLDLTQKQADLYRLVQADEAAEGMRLPFGETGKSIVYARKADPGDDMLNAELKSFLNAISDNAPPEVTVAEAIEALRVALEIDRIGRESLNRILDHA
jgi:predicted dehydrogenase